MNESGSMISVGAQLAKKLPPFVFLNAPMGSGKSSLAQRICELDSGAVQCSFAEPIRCALLATFYPENTLDPPNLRDGDVKARNIPGTGVSHRDWMVSFSTFMKGRFDAQIFGHLAKRTVTTLSNYYSRFVFDDNRYTKEIEPFTLAFGRDQCLMIHLEREGHRWEDEKMDHGAAASKTDMYTFTGAHHLVIANNGTIDGMVSQILERLK